jgi:hypothetical protein
MGFRTGALRFGYFYTTEQAATLVQSYALIEDDVLQAVWVSVADVRRAVPHFHAPQAQPGFPPIERLMMWTLNRRRLGKYARKAA